MSKTLLNKFKLVLAVIMAVALMLATGIFGTSAKAEDVFSLDSVEYTMDGASIRIGEEDGVNGVKFLAKLSVEDYDRITANVGEEKMYASIEYGVLIAPKYFTDYYPLNEDTVFGANGINKKVYDWAILGETRWEYNGTNSLPAVGGTGVRIINIYTNDWELGEDREHTEKYMYSGAIVNIQDGKLGGVNNLAEDFYSVAYIKATKEDGSVDYKFTSNSVSKSAAFLAQQTIDLGAESGLTAEQLQWLQENYVDAAKGSKKFTYTTNYFKEGPNGELLLAESVVTEAELDATVDAVEKTYDGYTLDENYEGTLLSGKVYANNSLTLNLYYVSDVRGGLLDKTVYSYIYPERLLSIDENATVKFYRMTGEYGFTVQTDDSSATYNVMGGESNCVAMSYTKGDLVSLENLDGTYRFVAGHNETIVQGGQNKSYFVIDDYVDFDVYDSTKDAVWNVAENAATGTRAARAWAAQTNRGYVIGWGVDFSLTEKTDANLPEGAPGTSYFYGTTNRNHTSTGSNLTAFTQNFYVKPLHGLEYYQRLADLDVSLYFDYYVGTDNVTIGGAPSETTYTSTRVKTIADATAKTVNLNTWYTVEVKLSTIISNWSNLSPIASDSTAGRWLAVDAVANPGDETKRVPLDVYFGNFRFDLALGFVEDEETHLVELATQAADVYDFTSTMSEEFKTKLNTWKTLFGDPVVTITDNYGNVTQLTSWSEGNRSVTNFKVIPSFHKEYKVDFKVNGIVVYTSHVDFYWEGNGFVYSKIANDADASAALKSFYSNTPTVTYESKQVKRIAKNTTDTVTYNDEDAIHFINGLGHNGYEQSEKYFSIYPVHSKEYLEMYANIGATLTLGIYLYVPEYDPAGNLVSETYTYAFNNYGMLNYARTTGGTYGSNVVNKWLYHEITVDELLEVWDGTFVAGCNDGWWTTTTYMFFAANSDATFAQSGSSLYFTVKTGSVDPSTIAHVTKDGVELVDVKDIQTYDLATLINEDGQKLLNDWSSLADITYSLTDMAGNVVLNNATSTTIDVSQETNQRHFKFTAYVGGYTAYVAEVDFYDSTKAPVWNTVSEDNVGFTHSFNVYSWGASKYAAVDNVAVSNGNYAFTFPTRQVGTLDNAVKVLPLHSFDYYNQFANLGVKLNFTYYFEAPDSGAAVTTSYRAYGNSDRPDIDSGEANKTTISISLDTFLTEDNWNAYVSNSIEGDTLLNYNFLIKELAWVARDYEESIVMYVGGLELVVGEIAAETDEEVKLIDVSTESENGTFDLYNAISTAGKTLIEKYVSISTIAYTLTDNAGNVVGPTESTTINVNDSANLKAYTLNAYIGGQLAYTGYIDLYDSTELPVWNTVSEDTLSFLKTHTRVYSRNDPAVNGTSTIATIDGVNYYKTTFENVIGGGTAGFMTLYGLHSEALYRELLYGKGFNLNFTFLYGNNVVNGEGKYDVTPEDIHWFGLPTKWRPGTTGNPSTSATTGLSTPITKSISFDTLLDNWDLYTAGKPTANHHSVVAYDYLVSLCSVAYSPKRESISMYLGEINLVLTGTIEAKSDSTVHLVDVDGEETFDVYSKISEEGKTLLNEYSGLVTYTLTDNSGVVTELGGKTVIDVTNPINLKAYTLNAYVYGQLAYTGYIDLYNSNDPFVWVPVEQGYESFVFMARQYAYAGDSRATTYSVPQNVSVSNGWFVANFAGRNVSSRDNVMTVLPLHSKEYYAELGNAGATLRFYYYPVSTSVSEYRLIGESTQRPHSSGVAANRTEENKITFNIDFSLIYNNWEEYTSKAPNEKTYLAYDYLISDIGGVWDKTAEETLYYLSGFELILDADAEGVVTAASTDAGLIDVKGKETIDLYDYISDDAKAVINTNLMTMPGAYDFIITDNAGNVTKLGKNTVLDVTNKSMHRAYTLEARMANTTIYTMTFDLYDSSADFDFNNQLETDLSFVKMFRSTTTNDRGDVSYDAQTGVYTLPFKTARDSKNQHKSLKILPDHSLEYYNRFLNKGIYLEFDFYYVLGESVGSSYNKFGEAPSNSTRHNLASNATVHVKIALDDLLAHWDTYTNPVSVNPYQYSMLLLDFGQAYTSNLYGLTYYISNFGLTYAGDFTPVTDETVYMEDVTGDSEISMLPFVTSQEVKNLVKEYSGIATYTLTDNNGEVIDIGEKAILDLTSGDAYKFYTINALIGDVVVYTGYADLYIEDEEIYWNDITNANSVQRFNDAHVAVDSTFEAGVFYEKNAVKYTATSQQHPYFTIKPIHGKGFYERFVDKGYYLNYSLYIDVATNSGTVAQIFLQSLETRYDTNTWIDRSLSIDEIVTYWDYIVDGKCAQDRVTANNACFASRGYSAMVHVYNTTNSYIYIAGGTISQDLSTISIAETVDVDVKENSALNLAEEISSKGQEIIDYAQSLGEEITYTYTDPNAETLIETTIDARLPEKHGAYKVIVYAGEVAIYTLTLNVSNSDLALVEDATAKTLDFIDYNDFIYKTEWLFSDDQKAQFARVDEYAPITYALVDGEEVESSFINAETGDITATNKAVIGTYTFKVKAGDTVIYTKTLTLNHSGYEENNDTIIHLIDVSTLDNQATYALTTNIGAATATRIKKVAKYDTVVARLYDGAGKLVQEYPITTANITDGWDAKIQNLILELDEEIDLRYYVLKVVASDTDLVVKHLDFYDSTKDCVWNLVHEDLKHYLTAWREGVGIVTTANNYNNSEVITIVDGYYKVQFPVKSNSRASTIRVLPLHTKEYYENFVGNSNRINFNFYQISDKATATTGDASDTGVHVWTIGYANANTNMGSRYDLATNKTVKLWANLDTIYNNWDAYMATTPTDEGGKAVFITDVGWAWTGNTCALAMYLGDMVVGANIADSETDPYVYLINAQNRASYDLTNVVRTDDGKKILDKYTGKTYRITDNNGNVINLGSKSTFAINDDMLRLWKFEVLVLDAVIYTGYVDLYDMSKPVIWNDITDTGSIQRYNSSHVAVDSTFTSVVFDQKQTLLFENSSGHPYFSMKALHDKTFYEKFVGQGYSLSYSFYADLVTLGGSFNQISLYRKSTSLASGNSVKNTWLSKTIPLDEIVASWDHVVNCVCYNVDDPNTTNGACWDSRGFTGMVYLYNTSKVNMYFAGFDIVTSTVLNAGDIIIEDNDITVIKENDVDVNYYNVADFMTNKVQSVIAQYALQNTITATLVPTYGAGEISLDGLLVRADQVELRAYNLTVKAGDTTICTAVVDFYDEEAEVVWANDLTADNTFIYTRAFTANGWTAGSMTKLTAGVDYNIVDASTVVDEASPLFGKTGKYIVWTAPEKIQLAVTIAPLHSKAYYGKMLGDKDYVLSAQTYGTGSYAGVAMDGYKNKELRWGSYSTWRTSMDHNDWFTFNWSFDNYLIPNANGQRFLASEHYLDFANIGNSHDERFNMISFEASTAGSMLYMGLPYVDSFAEMIYLTTGDMEVDINQSTYYDLTKVLDEKYQDKYNYYVTKYGYDAIYWKVTFADDTKTYIWAQEDGSAYLDLYEKIGETGEGASITVMDKIALGVVRINAYACDIPTFAPMSQPVKGINGQVNGANNNQQIIIIGSGTVAAGNLKGVTFTDMPAQNEVTEIAVADGTSKFLRTENFSASAQTYGEIDALYTESALNNDVALTYKAFKNEYEHAQIQIVAKADLGEYRLLVKDLTSGDNVLSADNFEVYHQLYTKLTYVAGGSVNPTGAGEYPDALLPMNVALKNDVAGLKAGVNQGVWITLYVPGDQEAGVYTGTFQLILGTSVYDVPVSVTVYDYEVAEETMMKTSLSLNYTDIVNLETPYEYDEEGNLIVNISSGNKDGTLTDDLRDAYINFFADHRVSTSPVVSSSAFSGSWQGYPYDPDALFSFDVIGTKGDGSPLYSYERPLRNKNEYGETVTVMDGRSKPGCEFTYGYPIYTARVDAYFEQLVTLAQNPGVTTYRIPVNQASSTNFNNDNIKKLFTMWQGSLYEINNDMEDGVKVNVINQIVLRDVMEKFFLKAMDLHKAGTSVDIFAKASVFPSWIDEFALNNSKIINAQYLLKSMKDFFPDLAGWLGRVYEDQIAGDEFLLNMLASIANMKIGVTANSLEHLDPNEHYANYVLVPELYGSEEGRAAVDAWANVAYDGNAEKWIYTAGNTYPQSNNNMEAPLLAGRLIGWMMSEYDIDGYLYWATMRSKYEDSPNKSAIEQAIGKNVTEGQIIELEDFYNNAIHYGSVGGDGFLVYPGSYYNVTGPIGTIRLESLRDGIEDYNIFYDLKEMYKEAGLEESFYNVMRRLAEMIYTGVNMKTPDGYIEDFAIARDSLANMLMMARDHKVYVDNVYNENAAWYFTVVAPSDIAEAVKTSVGATFLSATDVTVNDIAGSKMVFELPEAMATAGLLTVGYGDYVVNLSIETLLETAEVEALSWATPSAESVYTTHRSHNTYSYDDTVAGTKGTSVEFVTLDAENAVGGRTEGNYFYVSPTSNTDTSVLGFALLPTDITLDTVNSYIGKAALKFDVYMDNTYIADGSDRVGQKIFYKLGKSTNSSTKTHRWFSVTIDFKQIAENWDTLNTNTTKTYDNWTTSYRALFAVNNDSHDAEGVHTTSFYIGNFRIVHI